MGKLKNALSNRVFIAIASVILGGLIILLIRFATYHPAEDTHYHANFAVYINGQREQFKEPFYYEEVEESCSAETAITPHDRAHMHDNVNDVVHVEDHAVTWGQFFQNIGWDINPWFVKTPSTVMLSDNEHPVTFMVNGKKVANVVSQVIGDRDRLLVDYGSTSQDNLQKEFKSIASTAAHYDVTPDPETCSGSKKVSFRYRITHLF